MNFISADPGRTGALAVMDSDCTLIELTDMPIIEKDGHTYINVKTIMDMCARNNVQFAVVEKVWGMEDDSKQAIFSFGRNTGALESALTCTVDSLYHLTPKKWKAAVGLVGSGKKESAVKAGGIYGDSRFKGVRGAWKDGRGDAVMMGLAAIKLRVHDGEVKTNADNNEAHKD